MLAGRCLIALAFAVLLSACAAAGAPSSAVDTAGAESRLRGDTLALLGEVHDNAEGHQRRLDLLRRALVAGWRPAIAMEQFDTDRQPDIDRARREAPGDAQHLIDAASPARSGWDWALVRPVIALALQYGLPLLAANLSGADTGKVVRGGYTSVFAPDRLAALGLAQPADAAWQAAQEREIDAGHCGMLPATLWPAMARAQFARDAVMAEVLRAHGARGAVLIAGNGHVRRDIGVLRWLAPQDQARVLAIGYLESAPAGEAAVPDAAFDSVVRIAPAPRPDPCEAFAKRPKAAPG